MELARLQQELRPLCIETGIERLGVFGSVARGEDGAESDIDLVVSFENPVGIFELIDLEERLEKIIGRSVDLGTLAGLHPLIKDNVERDLKIIYEK